MSEETSVNVSMINVYQVAADIGKDFEGLIEKFGSDGFRDVMPKIIKSLEYLEEAVKKVDTQHENVRKFEEEIIKLEKQSVSKEKENVRLIQETDEVTEKKREDDIFWMKQLSELQNENSFLREQISEKDGIAVKERVQEQEAVKVLTIMKQTVDKQRNQLRTLEKDVTQKAGDIDALQQQVDRLAKLNQSLHQKNELIRVHAQSLMKEKSQIMSEMKALEKETEESSLQQNSTNDPKQNPEETTTRVNGQATGDTITFDAKDPNRPRFTLQELYQVLVERDELKLKLFLLEDDLKTEETLKERKESPAHEEPKSESSISKFFSSIFKSSSKKKGKPAIRHSDSGSSENNWEFLEKEDSPASTKLDKDSEEVNPEKVFIKVFEKMNKPKEEEVELRGMVDNHFSNEDDHLQGGTNKKEMEGSTTRRKLFVEDEGTDVDQRDENYNMYTNQSVEETNGTGASTEDSRPTEPSPGDGRDGCEEESLSRSHRSSEDTKMSEKETEGSCGIVEL